MLPGKKYQPEDILRILRRRFWVVVVPFALVAATTAVVAKLLPDTYRSEALINVIPQRVPESYVQSTVITPLEERLQGIAQLILSRTELEKIITANNLYAKERAGGIMEDVVERMRTRDIEIVPLRGDTFRVAYIGRDPRVAQKVTNELGSLFIDKSLLDRSQQAENTTSFLESWVEDARKSLQEVEQRLQAYKLQYSGELPDQRQANQQQLANTMSQIRALQDSIQEDQQRRSFYERSVQQIESLSESMPQALPQALPVTGADGQTTVPATTAQQLAAARNQVKLMEAQGMRPTHPDMRPILKLVADLEARLEQEQLRTPVSDDTAVQNLSPAELKRRMTIDGLKADIAALDKTIQSKRAEEAGLRQLAQMVQARLDRTPVRETEMVEMTRDYDATLARYNELNVKLESSKIAADMESRQIGEQFRWLDRARLPERPASPDRPLLNMLGLVGGLAVGLGLVALLEYRDGSFRTDTEVASVLALPVLAVVPFMQSEPERRRAKRRWLLTSAVLSSIVLGCLAIVTYTFVR